MNITSWYFHFKRRTYKKRLKTIQTKRKRKFLTSSWENLLDPTRSYFSKNIRFSNSKRWMKMPKSTSISIMSKEMLNHLQELLSEMLIDCKALRKIKNCTKCSLEIVSQDMLSWVMMENTSTILVLLTIFKNTIGANGAKHS